MSIRRAFCDDSRCDEQKIFVIPGLRQAAHPGMTECSQKRKKPAAISDGRPVFGVQQVLRPQWTQRLPKLNG
jgi:hypothetical protein